VPRICEDLVQEELNRLYTRFFATASVPANLVRRLSCPLLVAVGPTWETLSLRLLLVGQETHGWGFEGGRYYPWPYPSLKTFLDFQDCDRAVEALVHAYAAFAFARFQPENYRSPFWRAFRLLGERISANGSGEVLWTNLFRCSIDGGSVIRGCSSQEVSQILAFQHGLLIKR
jgi:hypothetical protein